MNLFSGRFAPSPTGLLHVGNARTALLAALWMAQKKGKFFLRIDDTDRERSKTEFSDALQRDLAWLGLRFDGVFVQSKRLHIYEEAAEKLKKKALLYPCYETKEELALKRQIQEKQGKSPRYDRSALKLSEKDKKLLESQGRKPHWRFRLSGQTVRWNDAVSGARTYKTASLSDPVLVRADESISFLLAGAADDLAMEITAILRGEDHIANTAIQKEIMIALDSERAERIVWGHLPLVALPGGRLFSKRDGGGEIAAWRRDGMEASVLSAALISLGRSQPIAHLNSIYDASDAIDLRSYAGSNPVIHKESIWARNKNYFVSLPWETCREKLEGSDCVEGGEKFWEIVRDNVYSFKDAQHWYNVCYGEIVSLEEAENGSTDLLKKAASLLPAYPWSESSWLKWLNDVQEACGMNRKTVAMALRGCLTSRLSGPSMHQLFPILTREVVLKRLRRYIRSE